MKLQFFILLIFSIISLNNGQLLKPVLPLDVAEYAQGLYYNCQGGSGNVELCVDGRFICEQIPNSEYYTITGIDFINGSPNLCDFNSLSIFQNLTYINVGSGINLMGDFFSSLITLRKLETLILQVLNTQVINQFPDSLKYVKINILTTQLPDVFLNSKIENLEISFIDSSTGSIQQMKHPNVFIKNLNLPFSENTIIFSETFTGQLPSLEGLTLSFDNSSGILIMPDFSIFALLKYLKLSFTSFSSSNTLPSSPCLINPNLQYYEVASRAFILNKDAGIDFSYCNSGFKFVVKNLVSNFECATSPCIKFPTGSSFEISNTILEFSQISFNGLVNFYCDQNSVSQTLPDTPNINPSNFKSFIITNGHLIGGVPEIYCNLKTSNFSFYNNTLDELPIPSCFLCGHIDKFEKNLIYVVPDCSNFKLSLNNSQVFPTNGSKVILTGNNLGWEYTFNNETFPLDIIQSQLTLNIPPGIGTNINYLLSFQQGNENITYSYSYYPPKLESYKTTWNGDQPIFNIYGSNFDYTNINNASIDGIKDLIFSFTKLESKSNNISLIDFNYFENNLIQGEIYRIQFNVGSQLSNYLEFYYFKDELKITDNSIKLNTTGGDITINGLFSTTNTSIVNCSLDGKLLLVKSVSNNTLTIEYPPSQTIRYVRLYLEIGGRNTFTDIQYIKFGDDSSDEISLSSPLRININLIIFILIILKIN